MKWSTDSSGSSIIIIISMTIPGRPAHCMITATQLVAEEVIQKLLSLFIVVIIPYH